MRLSPSARTRLEPWIAKELKDVLGPENFDADLTSYVLSLMSGTGTREHCVEQLRDFLGDAASGPFVDALFDRAASEGAGEQQQPDGDRDGRGTGSARVGTESPMSESNRRSVSDAEEDDEEADDDKHWRRRAGAGTHDSESSSNSSIKHTKDYGNDDFNKRRRVGYEDGKSLSSSRDWGEGNGQQQQQQFRRKDGGGGTKDGRWQQKNQWPGSTPTWPQGGYGSAPVPFGAPFPPYGAPLAAPYPMMVPPAPGGVVFGAAPGFVPPPPPTPAPGAQAPQPPLPPGRPPLPPAPAAEVGRQQQHQAAPTHQAPSSSLRPSAAPDAHASQSAGHTPSAADRETAIKNAKTYAFPGGGMRLIDAEGFYSPPEGSDPPPEATTILCTGVPHFVKETALFQHFKQFGIVVALRILRFPFAAAGADGEAHGDTKRVYNEAYIQYATAAQAQKCVSSPKSVLDNRFIKVFISNLCIVDPAKATAVSAPKGQDAAKEFRQRDVQRKYEELKRLRQQEELILNKKQELLEGQIQQCRKMAAKLHESGGDSEKNARMSEELESKILSLQSKLREVKEKREAMEAEFQENTAGLMEETDGASATGEQESLTEGGTNSVAAPAASGVARYSRAAVRGRGGRSGRGRGGRGEQYGGRGSVGSSPDDGATESEPAAEEHEGGADNAQS